MRAKACFAGLLISTAWCSAMAANPEAPLTTPAGITLQTVTVYGGSVGVMGGIGGYTAFADSNGVLLYSYADDRPGASSCSDECAKTHPPLAPADGAQPIGDWTVIKRGDGTAQWAVRGQPVYAFQAQPGSLDMARWRPVPVRPLERMPMPPGVDVQEVAGVAGLILVSGSGAPLYVHSGNAWTGGDACVGDGCARRYLPLRAPQLAKPVGDFTVASRNGLYQWAWKGRPLFTYQGDIQPGEVHGNASAWNVIMLARHFMPEGVKVGTNHFNGPILATAEGKTLYFRDREGYMQGHSLRSGVKPVSYAGKVLGTRTCEGECLRHWQPLAAPDAAKPTGNWSVVIRDDGSHQWAYKGFPLYSFDGDKAPGDMNGFDLYERVEPDRVKVPEMGILAHMRGAEALVWRAATP